MTQPAKAQDLREGRGREPSMEEILASIRRIIADDETPAAAPAAAPAPAATAPAEGNSQDDIDALFADAGAGSDDAGELDGDVFELTEEMALPDPHATALAVPSIADDIEITDSMPHDEVPAATAAPAARAFDPATARVEDFQPRGFERDFDARDDGPRDLPQAAQQAMLSQSTVSAVESAFNSLASTVLSNNARTLEDLVKEMLRPMLKSWLDDNLPTLVERIVRAEIERVSRGR